MTTGHASGAAHRLNLEEAASLLARALTALDGSGCLPLHSARCQDLLDDVRRELAMLTPTAAAGAAIN